MKLKRLAGCAIMVPVFVGNVLAGSPAQLKPISDADMDKIKSAIPAKATAKPAKQRKVLVFWLCKGFYHRSIPVGNTALVELGKMTGAYEAVLSNDMEVFSKENLAQFDAVVFNNTTRLTFDKPEQREALMDFVKSGKGVIGIHAGSDNFYNWPEAAEMMGGQFNGHPWGAGGTWAIKIDEPDHVLCNAFECKAFKLKDEIYDIKGAYSRDTHRVLLSLDMSDPSTGSKKGRREDKDYGIAWIKPCGDGRVFYCSLGHNSHIYWTPEVLQHYLDGIQYALGDLKADDSPSAKLSPAPKAATINVE
jgi:type 1 glutamine amidotransferase